MQRLALGLSVLLTAAYVHPSSASLESSLKRIRERGQNTDLTLQSIQAMPHNQGWRSADYTETVVCEEPQSINGYFLQNCAGSNPDSLLVRMRGGLQGGAGEFTLSFYDRGADGFNEGDFVVAYFDNETRPMYFIGGIHDGRIMHTWLDPNDGTHRHNKKFGKFKNFLANLFEIPKVEGKYADFLSLNPNSHENLEKLVRRMQMDYMKRLLECGREKGRYSSKED